MAKSNCKPYVKALFWPTHLQYQIIAIILLARYSTHRTLKSFTSELSYTLKFVARKQVLKRFFVRDYNGLYVLEDGFITNVAQTLVLSICFNTWRDRLERDLRIYWGSQSLLHQNFESFCRLFLWLLHCLISNFSSLVAMQLLNRRNYFVDKLRQFNHSPTKSRMWAKLVIKRVSIVDVMITYVLSYLMLLINRYFSKHPNGY